MPKGGTFNISSIIDAGDIEKQRALVAELNEANKNLNAALNKALKDDYQVQLDSQLPLRKGRYNTLGREAEINLNTFEVLGVPTKPVYQYDITMVDGHNKQPDKRMLINKIWKSKAVQSGLGAGNWLFDGNKLAW